MLNITFDNMKYIVKDADTYVTDDMYQELTYFENKLNYLHKNYNVIISGLHLSACSWIKIAYKKHEMINKQAYVNLIQEIKDWIDEDWMPY